MKNRLLSSLLCICMATALISAALVVHADAASSPPEYDKMSTSYKKGPYYQKLMEVSLTGNQAADVVNVAYSQVGYHAGGSASDLSGTSTASGNYVEYFNLIAPSSQNKNWCATFVTWCFREANIPTSVMPSTAGCGTVRNTVKKNGATWHAVDSGYWPKKGDVVLYEAMDSNYEYYVPAARDANGLPTLTSHVAIVVTDYDGKTCDTVQRKSDQVKVETIKNLYSAGPKKDGTLINRIQGFVTPNYTNNPSPNTKYYGKVHDTDGSLSINAEPKSTANGATRLGTIPESATCIVYTDKTSGKWYWVEYNGVQGYAHSNYIALGSPVNDVHIHNANYKAKGYCDACGTWLPNQNNNASVTTGLYMFTADSPYNQLMDHPYQASETYGKCYKVFNGGDLVNVVGGVVNGGGNTWYKINYNGTTGYAFSGRLELHTHSDNYSKGYCEVCKTWRANQNDNASVETGQYIFTGDSPYNQLMDHPYQISETYGTCYKIYSGGDVVNVTGAVVNAFGNTWYKISDNGITGYAFSERLAPWTDAAELHTHDLSYVSAQEPTCTKDGHGEYWECDDCGLIFSDEEGENETSLTDLRVPALGHDFKDGFCTRCDAEDPDYTEPEPEPEPEPGLENPFVDVPDNAYYCAPVLWAYYAQPQITDGMDDTHFGPNQTVTRGQAVTFLWRAMGKPAPKSARCPFTDVKTSDYYYQPVLWALEQGITNGTSASTFSPNATLTRGHIVTFLWRTTGRPGETGAGQWYTDAVNWARTSGLLDGTAAVFDPINNCPRSDVVTYLYRADQEGVLTPAESAYDFVLDNCSWTEAFQKARAAGGHLVRIDSLSEYTVILKEMDLRGLDYVKFRIGARRNADGQKYYWVDDNNRFTGKQLNSSSSWAYDLWEPGEPSYEWNGTAEDVAEIVFRNGNWYLNDTSDAVTVGLQYYYGYIIEY